MESRWMVARVTCIVSSALLFYQYTPNLLIGSRFLVAIIAAVAAFSFPAEVAKAFAVRSAERSAPLLIGFLWPFEMLAAPFAAPAVYLGHLVRHRFPNDDIPSGEIIEEEVGLIVKDGERSGSIAPDEAQMLTNVLGFGELTAKDVMVPRTHVTSLSLQTNLTELLGVVIAEEHSRYPVYQERIDNIVGILHVKDLLPYVAEPEKLRSLELETLLHRPALFVSESQTAASVLREMRHKQQHLAIVIDEFGGMSGALSLEDLLERIVGDIRDEHDEAEPPVIELGNGKLMVDASLSLVDLGRYLDTELPDNDDYTSLGGLLVAEFGRVPPIGAKLSQFGLDFLVRDADERHVAKVELQRTTTSPRESTSSLFVRSLPNGER
jgi:putative hemolysin